MSGFVLPETQNLSQEIRQYLREALGFHTETKDDADLPKEDYASFLVEVLESHLAIEFPYFQLRLLHGKFATHLGGYASSQR